MAVSGNGSRVGFFSNANLLGENPHFKSQFFVYEVETSTLTQVTNQNEFSSDRFEELTASNDEDRFTFLSDGDLTGENPDNNFEVFLYDIPTETLTQITQTDSSTHRDPDIRDDGTLMVFDGLTNIAGSNEDFNQEIFMYDTTTSMFDQITDTEIRSNTNTEFSGDEN